MDLPQFILLKSDANNKFLCYEKEKGRNHASLRFCYDMSAAPQTGSETKTDFHFLKFKVEEAKTAKGFVHIRTCYNNRYLVRKGADEKTIVAEAHEAEEDQSKWSCTLFKPIILGTADDKSVAPITGEKPKKIQLVHISELKEHYVDGSGDGSWLEQRSSASDSDTLTAYNAEAMALLPEHLTFISFDGRFLSNFQGNDLGFETADVESRGVAMTTNPVATPQYIILRARDSNRLWRLNPNANGAIGLVDSNTVTTRFGPILVSDGTHIALRVDLNNNFVDRIDHAGLYQGVAATESTISPASLLRVGEPVRSRQIVSIEYNLEDSTVYNTHIVNKYVASMSNNTGVEQTVGIDVEYTSARTMSWNQSLTVHVGIPASWSGIPYVGPDGVSVSSQQTQVSVWGEEIAQETTVKYTQTLTLQPRKKATLKLEAMTSSCTVPFTCVVRDVMTDGTTREYTKTDCWFTGTNEYQLRTIIDIEDV